MINIFGYKLIKEKEIVNLDKSYIYDFSFKKWNEMYRKIQKKIYKDKDITGIKINIELNSIPNIEFRREKYIYMSGDRMFNLYKKE